MTDAPRFAQCPCCERTALQLHHNDAETQFWVVSSLCGNFGPYAPDADAAWLAWDEAVHTNPGAFLPVRLRATPPAVTPAGGFSSEVSA
jgi:hypothetical protein